jgi:hypothetical protein
MQSGNQESRRAADLYLTYCYRQTDSVRTVSRDADTTIHRRSYRTMTTSAAKHSTVNFHPTSYYISQIHFNIIYTLPLLNRNTPTKFHLQHCFPNLLAPNTTHTLADVNTEGPDTGCPELNTCIPELIADSYQYILQHT